MSKAGYNYVITFLNLESISPANSKNNEKSSESEVTGQHGRINNPSMKSFNKSVIRKNQINNSRKVDAIRSRNTNLDNKCREATERVTSSNDKRNTDNITIPNNQAVSLERGERVGRFHPYA